MIKMCCLLNCKPNYAGEEVAIAFYLPVNEDFINRNNWELTKLSALCLKLFEQQVNNLD